MLEKRFVGRGSYIQVKSCGKLLLSLLEMKRVIDVDPFADLEDNNEELETHKVMIRTKLANPDS